MNQPVESVPVEAPATGAAAALLTVLFEPRRTFEALKPKAPWILPLLVFFLAVGAFTWVNWPHLVDQRIEAFRSSDRLAPEQKAVILKGMEESRENPGAKDLIPGPLFAVVFSLLGAALWLLIGNVVMGGDGTFRQLWSAFTYAGMVLVVEMILKTAMIQMKKSADVYTSLALVAPDLDSTGFVFRALDAVDVFSIWFFLVMGTGVSVMCKVKPQKAMTVSLVAFAVWAIGIKAGLGSVLGGFLGM